MAMSAADRNLRILQRNALIGGLAGGLMSQYGILFFKELGGSYLAFGGLAFITTLISSSLSLVGGVIADRMGRRNIFLFFNFIGLISGFAVLVVQDWGTLAVIQVLGTLGGLAGPARAALVADAIHDKASKSGATKTLAIFQSIGMLPQIITPIIGGYILTVFGVNIGYRLAALLGSLANIIVFMNNLGIEETLDVTKPRKKENRNPFRFEIPQEIRANMASFALIMVANAAVAPYYIVFFTEVMNLEPFQWGLIVSAQTIVAIIFKIPGGIIADNVGKKKLMMGSVLLVAGLPTLFTFATGFDDALFVSLLMVAFGMFYGQAAQAIFIMQTPTEKRGRMQSVWNTVMAFSRSSGQFAGGFLFQINPRFPFIFYGIAELAAVYVMMWIKEPDAMKLDEEEE